MKKLILIVDDSRSLRQQISFSLVKGGYDVIEAGNGIEGLDQLRSNSNIAFVISDIHMPEMNGLEFLKAVKADPALSSINFMMLTTETEATMIAEAKASGAKAFMVKPFDPNQLLRAVDKIIQK